MTQPVTTADETVLQRRGFLRGGALLAAAAGGAVAATAGIATPAVASDTEVLALTVGLPPLRFLDTRTSDGRASIVGSSSSALDSKHRLRKNAWIDVAVFPADRDIDLLSVFVNLGSRSSAKAGELVVTEPEQGRPSAWTLHHAKGAAVSNSAIVGVGIDEADSLYTVRIYAGSVTHVVLDLTGVSALLSLGGDDRASARTSQRAGLAKVLAAARTLQR